MGASPLMSLGWRAMQANYAALQVTGHNIANANVDGYSRQRVELGTVRGQYSGVGYFGKGSDVQTISRSHDAFQTREAFNTSSLASMDAARLAQLRQLENMFQTGERGIGYSTQQFLNSMSDLASRPGDYSTRQVVLAQAEEMAARFADAGRNMDAMQADLREDLKVSLAEVNEITQNIASVNDQIAAARGMGQPPNDLLDQRDRLLARLSEQVSFTTVPADDGTLSVFAGGGQSLVLGNRAQPLAVVGDASDPSRVAVAIVGNGSPLRLDAQALGGGRIAGLLRFQNDDLVDAQLQLGQLYAAVAGAVNAQQALGMNLHEPVGSVKPGDLFAIGEPRAQPHTGNRKDAAGMYVGSVSLTITSPGELQASEYDFAADPSGLPGRWQLTRRSDGLVRSVADGDEVDGFRITLGNPPPAAGDKYLLQPVTRAAAEAGSLLDDPLDLAAASPLAATIGAGNTGTAAIGSLKITSPAVNPQHTASISFTNDTGSYAWELRDRSTNALVSSGTGTWKPGQPLPSDPDAQINGFELTLSGVPHGGDTLTVEMTSNPGANNGNAVALAALRDARLVGQSRQPDGRLTGGANSTDAYAASMADIGVRVQGAAAISSISGSLATRAEQTRSSAAGVNLDEEAARLIEFQQSYQAAAKVLQIAQSIFDTLLQAATG